MKLPASLLSLLLLVAAASPAAGGDVTSREGAEACRETPQEGEEYDLEIDERHHRGKGYRAGSEVVLCGGCIPDLEVSVGSSFRGVDVDLFLRSIKGRVRFSGNLLPEVTRIREWCRDHPALREHGGKRP